MTPPLTRDGDGTFVDADGVKRRTILAGAAWSIPVISVATAAPAFAATTDLSLAFDKSTYTGEACKTISGAKVTATRNGVAAVGESVTVTLADGFTFADGSTSYTTTTGSDGSISLPAINVPAQGGNSTLTATSGSASTSAFIQTPSKIGSYQYNAATDSSGGQGAPSTSKAIGDGTFLADNGQLWYAGKVIASGVKNAAFDFTNQNGVRISYVTDTAAYQYNGDTGQSYPQDKVPTSSTAIGDGTFLADNGQLWYAGKVIASGVKNAAFDFTNQNGVRISYVTDTAAYQYNGDTGQSYPQSNVPTSSTAIGDGTFLADNGQLWYASRVIASGVKNAAFDFTNQNGVRINYVTSTAAFQYNGDTGRSNEQSGVPASSTAIGDGTFLGSDGNLRYQGNIIAVKVTSAAFDYTNTNSARINYIGAPVCKR